MNNLGPTEAKLLVCSKNGCFWENWLMLLLCTYCVLSLWNVWKLFLQLTMRHNLIILGYIGLKLSVFRQRRFCWIKKYSYFSVFNELHHDKTSQKFPHKESWGLRLHKCGQNLLQSFCLLQNMFSGKLTNLTAVQLISFMKLKRFKIKNPYSWL